MHIFKMTDNLPLLSRILPPTHPASTFRYLTASFLSRHGLCSQVQGLSFDQCSDLQPFTQLLMLFQRVRELKLADTMHKSISVYQLGIIEKCPGFECLKWVSRYPGENLGSFVGKMV